MQQFLKKALHPTSAIRIFGIATTLSIFTCAAVGVISGLEALFAVLVLAVIEITFSFENAVVNAKVLAGMSKIWQTIFLTIGIAIAVFGMRMLLPLVLVSVTANLSIPEVFNLALYHAEEYAHHLEEAHAVIAAFGGGFLLMIFLRFLFEERDIHWIHQLEQPLRSLNVAWIGPLIISSIVMLVVAAAFAGDEFRQVVTAGAMGIGIYTTVKLLGEFFQRRGEKKLNNKSKKASASQALQAGLFSFIYLELLDASFSFDGVVAAFAITKNVVLIAAGLGIGAIYVRSLTIFLLRRGTLGHYVFLEHGAYYAVGTLATIMVLSIGYHIPSFITGILGVSIIGLSVLSSDKHAKKKLKETEHTM